MKRVLNKMPRLAMIVMMSIVCSCVNGSNKNHSECRVNDDSGTPEVVTEVSSSNQVDESLTPISIEEAYMILDEMIVENGLFFKGFRSIENVNRIMEKHDYKKIESYYIYREFSFSPFFYKNCAIKEDSDDVPTPSGKGVASFVGIDEPCLVISPFTKSAFDDYINQIKKSGAKLIKESETIISFKYKNIEIDAYKKRCKSINYAITMGKE